MLWLGIAVGGGCFALGFIACVIWDGYVEKHAEEDAAAHAKVMGVGQKPIIPPAFPELAEEYKGIDVTIGDGMKGTEIIGTPPENMGDFDVGR